MKKLSLKVEDPNGKITLEDLYINENEVCLVHEFLDPSYCNVYFENNVYCVKKDTVLEGIISGLPDKALIPFDTDQKNKMKIGIDLKPNENFLVYFDLKKCKQVIHYKIHKKAMLIFGIKNIIIDDFYIDFETL